VKSQSVTRLAFSEQSGENAAPSADKFGQYGRGNSKAQTEGIDPDIGSLR
jgi:hypothetical protein